MVNPKWGVLAQCLG